MKQFFPLLMFFFVCSFSLSETTQFTKRFRNDVRSGPGAYYELVSSLPEGTEVTVKKNDGNWVNITTKQKVNGWISKNCLLDKLPDISEKDQTAISTTSKSSKTSIAAAVRGFAERFGNAGEGNEAFLSYADENVFSLQEYRSFLKSTLAELSPIPLDQFGDEKNYLGEYISSLAEQGVGLGIAARIANNGMVNDSAKLKYLNMLGTYLIESTPSYDVQFHFFILNDTKPTAYSAPGGYIFISQGMLNQCINEAQLAGVIAHEIAHIILNHGLKEIKSRAAFIKIEEHLQALEQQIGDELKETQAALEQFSSVSWELANRPRTAAMEEEADNTAATLLAHAGYDPNALSELIKKMESESKKSLTQNYDQEQTLLFVNMKQRKEHLQKFIERTLSTVKGKLNLERFQKIVK